jgi:hypothetical protein
VATRFPTSAVCALASWMVVFIGADTKFYGATPSSLDVLIDDSVDVQAGVLDEARRTAARIFGRMDVQVVWLDTPAAKRRREELSDPGAQQAFLRSLYVVRIVRARGREGGSPSARALGFAISGSRVTAIVYSRAERLARDGATIGLVLGHIIAHELGHLLLQRTSHSATGLMRATLDVPLAQQGGLLFTADEADAIRARLR